jgi:CelD/BcsL family acetyltransferase involved in cellulose biosynthesis
VTAPLRNRHDLAEPWEDLAAETGAAPWLWPGWFDAWNSAFGSGTIEPVEVWRGGRLVGVAPMSRSRGALTSPTNWHTPWFGLLACDPGAERQLADALFRRRAHRVTMAFVLATDLPAVRDAARRAGHRLLERTLERSPYVDCETTTWEGYEATLGAKMRRELRRRRRRLEAEGTLSFDVADGTERLDALLDEGFAVEAASWKGERETAISSQPATERFYRDVARWAASRGWLRLGFLRLDDRALAFDFSIEAGGVHYLLKTGYDPARRESAPGKLLRHEMLRRAFDAGVSSYEFLGTDEPWKLEWTTSRRDLRRLDAFARSATGIAHWSAFTYGRPVAKRALAAARR